MPSDRKNPDTENNKNTENSMLDDVFVSLRPPERGLQAVRDRLRARQQRRVLAGGLALAALALVAVLPALQGPRLPAEWQGDVAVAAAAPGMAVAVRGGAATQEVGRTEDVLMVRILAPVPPP
jgi:hypothetical protein